MAAVGGVYKQINKYLQQAKKLDKVEPAIAYYCQRISRYTQHSTCSHLILPSARPGRLPPAKHSSDRPAFLSIICCRSSSQAASMLWYME